MKIGRTVNMQKRLTGYNSASPSKAIEIIWSKEVPKKDLLVAERALRYLVGRKAVKDRNMCKKREWFKIPQKTAIEAVSLLF